MSLLQTIKFSEINNIYPVIEKIIDLLMMNGGEIILKERVGRFAIFRNRNFTSF